MPAACGPCRRGQAGRAALRTADRSEIVSGNRKIETQNDKSRDLTNEKTKNLNYKMAQTIFN